MSFQEKCELLACKRLGLIHPDNRAAHKDILLELGTFRIIESRAALEEVIEHYLKSLKLSVDEEDARYSTAWSGAVNSKQSTKDIDKKRRLLEVQIR